MENGKRQDRDNGLGKVDHTRRAYLRKMAAGAAFAVPLVASFSTDGLHFNSAEALVGGNQTDGGGLLARLLRFIFRIIQSSQNPAPK
jgi:hypothetical protein